LHTALSFMISLGASCFIIFQNPKYFHTTDFAFPGKLYDRIWQRSCGSVEYTQCRRIG
jgi:hypothetical protein